MTIPRLLGASLLLAATMSPALASPQGQVPDTLAQRAKACTGCHGPQGRAKPDGYVPRLAGKPAGYLLEQLLAFRDGRRQHATMSQLLANLTDGYLGELAGHFATQEVPYPAPTQPALAGPDAQRAERLVRSGDPQRRVPACVACHGDTLAGIAPKVPGLLGLPRDYVVGQLGAWRAGQRRSRAPDCMAAIAGRLSPDDIALVGRWLASQPVPAGTKPSSLAPATWPMPCGSVAP